MVVTRSLAISLGTPAPPFELPDCHGNRVALSDFADAPATVVVFMCNHCPFVKHIASSMARFAEEYQAQGVAFIGINSNDAEAFPDDSPARMAAEIERRGYTFPYLIDESQEVAKAYGAACTPDFFLLDGRHRLVYHGQFDSSRPGKDIEVSGQNLRNAVDAVLSGDPVAEDQQPSLGCNIKWKKGNSPSHFQG